MVIGGGGVKRTIATLTERRTARDIRRQKNRNKQPFLIGILLKLEKI